MPPFLYRCANTGDNVQAWAADGPEDDDLTYVQVTCLACTQAHLVNPKTGNVLGEEDGESVTMPLVLEKRDLPAGGAG
jgi:hypothetical protein